MLQTLRRPRVLLLLVTLTVAVGCGGPAGPAPLGDGDTGQPDSGAQDAGADGAGTDDSGAAGAGDSGTDGGTDDGVDPVIGYEERAETYPTLDDLECASGTSGCSASTPWIDGTCCSEGAVLPEVGSASGSEVVGIAQNAALVVSCGGFGAQITRLDEVANLYLGSVGSRCQNAAFGPLGDDGTQVVYLTHHGDSWVSTPSLAWVDVRDDGGVAWVDSETSEDVLFEGAAWSDGWLYVASHASGLRVYQTDDAGVPTLSAVVDGFDNAAAVVVEGQHAYVTDGDALQVVDVSDPSAAQIIQTVALAGTARDVSVDGVGEKLYVALGTAGYQHFALDGDGHVVEPDTDDQGRVATDGSIQGVSASQDFVALAAWNHVQLRRASDQLLLGTKKTRDYHEYEQDLAIALDGTRLYVGEWEGVHVLEFQEGVAAPDLWFAEDQLNFWGDGVATRELSLVNRGALDLELSDPGMDDESWFSVTLDSALVAPAQTGGLTVTYTPDESVGSEYRLQLETNDPDADQADLDLPVYVASGSGLQAGDTIDEAFSFLDPTGEDDLDNVLGNVVVLAYFALF